MAKKKFYKKLANTKFKKKPKKSYSAAERKAYWMGVGAGEVYRENDCKPMMLPLWKVQDLGNAGVAAYRKGFAKKYSSFD